MRSSRWPFWLPPFGFAVVGMNVLTDGGRADHLANIFAVLDDGIALVEVLQGDFVADGDIRLSGEFEVRVIVGHDAKHVGPGGKPFDDDNTDIVLVMVDKKLRNGHGRILPEMELGDWMA